MAWARQTEAGTEAGQQASAAGTAGLAGESPAAPKRTGKKRGNGEGTIGQKADGRWEARITLPNGKRASFMGKTRKEARDKMAVALRDLQKGVLPPEGRQTLGQFLERYLADVAKLSVRPSTYRSYEQICRVHLIPGLGRTPLVKLTPQQVQAFLNQKRESGLAPRSVQRIHAVLRQALGQAERWNMIPRNTATLVSPPRAERFDAPVITVEDARAILAAVRGDRLEPLVTVALSVGLRLGEATGLRWEDIDFEAGTLSVRKQLQRVHGKLQLVDTKTDGSRRTLTMPRSLIEALRAHRVRQLEDRLLVGERWRDHGLVFTTTLGTPLDGGNITQRWFQGAMRRAGLFRYRFHDLRHGAASLLLAQGVELRVVSDVLGHSGIRITADLYAHVAPRLRADAAQKMQDALFATM